MRLRTKFLFYFFYFPPTWRVLFVSRLGSICKIVIYVSLLQRSSIFFLVKWSFVMSNTKNTDVLFYSTYYAGKEKNFEKKFKSNINRIFFFFWEWKDFFFYLLILGKETFFFSFRAFPWNRRKNSIVNNQKERVKKRSFTFFLER